MAFYVDWLGFRIDWEDKSADGHYYLQISRSAIVLHLTTHPEESCTGSKALAAITGLLAFHHQLLRKETSFPTPVLKKTTWSSRVMQVEVHDPFGNCLVFAEPCA